MDITQEENNGPAKEGSDQYIWLAGAFVGGFLILMIIIIIGILLWKYVKKQNASIHQNWAGPSPLADGNVQDDGNCMNSSILGRSMSLSHISTSPIISNEHPTLQEVYETGGEYGKEAENEKQFETLSTLSMPTVPAAPTKYASPASDAQMCTQITGNGLVDETFPPPPLDLSQEFPMPPPPEAMHEQDKYLQSFPEIISNPQNGNSIQEPLNLQTSSTDALHITNILEDQLLPPPPSPDF